MKSPRALAIVVPLLIAALALEFAALAGSGRSSALEEDEADYLRAATHLVRDGVLSHTWIETSGPPPDAYREPAISVAYAGGWRLFGCAPPASESALFEALAPGSCTGRAVRAIDLALFALTIGATALAVRAAGGGRVAALAGAVLVAASPALRLAAAGAYSENLAAPLVAGVSAALAFLVAAKDPVRRRRATIVAVALSALAPLARTALLALPVATATVVFFERRKLPPARRTGAALAVLALCLLPSALWVARNARATGVVTFADSRAIPTIREELDRQIAADGAIVAALHWTPFETARQRAERLAPTTIARPRWTGDGNYLTRAWRRRGEAIRDAATPGRPPAHTALLVDRALSRQALLSYVARPVDHLRASAAVAWRSLFSERSPEWAHPFDLAFGVGLALAAALAALLASALRRRDGPTLALLLPALLLYLGHVLLTEGLPRYGWASLPVAWAAVALHLRRARRMAPPAGKEGAA